MVSGRNVEDPYVIRLYGVSYSLKINLRSHDP